MVSIWTNKGEPPLVWRDNVTLVFPEEYELTLLNTENRGKMLFTGDTGIAEDTLIATAPDLTRYFDVDYENTSTGTNYFYHLIDTASGNIIKTLPGTLFSHLLYDERENSIDLWSPDSSQFLIYSRESESDPFALTVMDRNGEKNIPILTPDQDGLYFLDNRWTAASNAVQLMWVEQADKSGEYWNFTYRDGIAFPAQQLLVDLCSSPGYGFKVLSYDGSQIALDVNYKNQHWLSIFNWKTGEWYVVKAFDGWLTGWATW